jgi:hypothetical protein
MKNIKRKTARYLLFVLLIVCIFIPVKILSQVTNPGFETNSGLPNCSWIPHSFKSSLADGWIGWSVSANTSDYFHTTSGNIGCIAFTPVPRTGSAHVGFAYGSSNPSQYLFREFVQTQTAVLNAGVTYEVKFYVKRAAGGVTGNIGMYLSQSPFSSINGLTPQVSENITSAPVYHLVSGTFTPLVTGQYYAAIGCFTPGSVTSLNYFFVDDVSIQVLPIADLISRDDINDAGAEPNNTAGVFYSGTDIWVRQNNDAGTVHQNPVYRDPSLLLPNYIKVRVRNIGNTQGSGTVKVYFAKGSTNLEWPLKWVGNYIGSLVFGDYLASQTVTNLPAGNEIILTFPWYPPNPVDYIPYGANAAHWCLLSRIETSPVSPFGMTFPEITDINYNVKYNNNIVWKNLTIMRPPSPDQTSLKGTVMVQGNKQNNRTRFNFSLPERERFLEDNTVRVVLSDNVYSLWLKGGKQGAYITDEGRNTLLIKDYSAYISSIALDKEELGSISVQMDLKEPGPKTEYNFYIEQYDINGDTSIFLGGEVFAVNKESFNEGNDIINKPDAEKEDGRFYMANHPNPFNPSTLISFNLPVEMKISMKVYDLSGKLVATLVDNQQMSVGLHEVTFNGSGLASGIYFYRLEGDGFSDTKRMLLVK